MLTSRPRPLALQGAEAAHYEPSSMTKSIQRLTGIVQFQHGLLFLWAAMYYNADGEPELTLPLVGFISWLLHLVNSAYNFIAIEDCKSRRALQFSPVFDLRRERGTPACLPASRSLGSAVLRPVPIIVSCFFDRCPFVPPPFLPPLALVVWESFAVVHICLMTSGFTTAYLIGWAITCH